VRYGISKPPGMSTSDTSMVTSHTVVLYGLDPETTYFFEVQSTDAAGNTAVEDNGGLYFTFTTTSTPGGGSETRTWTGTMTYSGQSKDYTIDVTASGTIIIDLTWSPSPLNRLDLYLYNPAGTLVKMANGSSGKAHLENTATANGTWKIKVYANFLLITPEHYTLTATYPVGVP